MDLRVRISTNLLNQMLIIVYSFLATGESFWMLHVRFRRGVSTIASAVYEVCDAIYSVLQPIYMVPPTEDDWRQIEHRFRTRWNFPNCVGAIDGKHIMIKKPPNSQSLFYNYKGFFSIVLLALVDADYRFTYVDVGNYGSNGDAGIFKHSALGVAFVNGQLNIPGPKRLPGWPQGAGIPHCIVGDEAFPLRMDLMRPFPRGKKENRLPYEKTIFNYRVSRARRISENAFGILVQRFRVFDRRICMDDHNVVKIVKATCVLHNYLCTASMDVAHLMGRLNPDGQVYMGPHAMLRDLQNQGYHGSKVSEKVRQIYMEYFNSNVGAVPWQGNRIRHR